MSEHTKEPWEWSEHQFNFPPFEGTLEKECGIYPPIGESGPVAITAGKANARRIVACVNACKGITTEALEHGKEVIISHRTHQDLLRQRARLLEALKKYANRDNWGYYDESGCPKMLGSSTDACFIGPEVAEVAIAEVEAAQ